MAKFELLIAANDEQDLSTGHKRKKEGDIIAVRPHPWNWGKKEIDNYLVVIVESDMSIRDLRVQFEDALMRNKTTGAIIRKQELLIAIERDNTPDEYDKYEPYAKRVCKIDLADIKNEMADLDLVKVRDRDLKYQPFKSAKQLVSKFTDLEEKDVDTVSAAAAKDSEFAIDLTVKSIVTNKINDTKESLKKEVVTRGII